MHHPGFHLVSRLPILLLPRKGNADETMKRPAIPDHSGSRTPVVFCTSCGAELENFCLSEKSADVEAVRRTLAQCRKEGRFVGEYCAKLFVASGADFEAMRRELADDRWLDPDPSSPTP